MGAHLLGARTGTWAGAGEQRGGAGGFSCLQGDAGCSRHSGTMHGASRICMVLDTSKMLQPGGGGTSAGAKTAARLVPGVCTQGEAGLGAVEQLDVLGDGSAGPEQHSSCWRKLWR